MSRRRRSEDDMERTGGRRRVVARWGVVLAVLAVTWAFMLWLLYTKVAENKL